MTPAYMADADVGPAMDQALRDLLCVCFTKPHDAVFRDRRHFKEPPAHRWIVRGRGAALLAHAAVHEKEVESDGVRYSIGGIAEVCVHPDARGQGLVRGLLTAIHPWLAAREVPFALLFGEPAVYQSSGYKNVGTLFVQSEEDGQWKCSTHAMVCSLLSIPWPSARVQLIGPSF